MRLLGTTGRYSAFAPDIALEWKEVSVLFFVQAEDGIRNLVRSRGLGDVYKRQVLNGGFLKRGNPKPFYWALFLM